jgi:hypothetical protein
MMNPLVFLILFITLISVRADDIPHRDAERASMVQLIANPTPYNLKYIQTHGYFRYEDGFSILYLSREMKEHAISEDAIWLYLGKNIKNPEQFADKWVTVQGVFGTQDKGRWQAFAGSLGQVDVVRLND